jgi:AcrR family transcriptional regulator
MEKSEDGRVARGQRTREAVIDTLFELYCEGNLTPTIEQIAERIGRTSRAIYQHFQDKEALAVAMAERQLAIHGELYRATPIVGDVDQRIRGIVTHRSTLFEAVAPARRSALVRLHLSPELQQQQTGLAARFRDQLAETFRSELSVLSTVSAADTLDLLDLHTSWETWERLRTWQGISVDRAEQLITQLINRALRS